MRTNEQREYLKELDHIARLKRRRDWLVLRIRSMENAGKDCSWDRAEASALSWAIQELELKRA